MRRRLLVCLLLVAAPLAGCTGSDGSEADRAEPAAAPGEGSPTLQAPNWSVGDYWTYSDARFDDVTWVVTGERGSDWIVDTTSPPVAFIDARTDISFFGERGKGDLSGSQGDQRVRYFDWPLEANKTWTTPWDGVEREVTVDRIEDGLAHLTARQDGRVAVEYTYDGEAGHFGEFTFFDANGTETIRAELADSGSDFQEPAVRWQLERAVDLEGDFGVQPAAEDFEFEVPGDATDLWLDLSVRCPSGGYDFGFGGNDSGYSSRGPCPAEANETGPVVEDPGPGTYRGGFVGSSPGGPGSYDVLLLVRTLQQVPVGE